MLAFCLLINYVTWWGETQILWTRLYSSIPRTVLQQCLAHSRSLINGCWTDDWISKIMTIEAWKRRRKRRGKRKMWGKERRESNQRYSDYSDMEKENQAAKEKEGKPVNHNWKAQKRSKRKHRKEGLFFTAPSAFSWFSCSVIMTWGGTNLRTMGIILSSMKHKLSCSLNVVIHLWEA